MSGNIYEMLNDSEINLDDYSIEGVNDIEKANMKKKFRTSINKNKGNKRKKLITSKVKVAVVAIFVATNVLLVSTNGVNVYANMGESIIKTFRGVVGDNAEYEKYSTNVNLSCYDKGIKVVINEVVTDGNEINLSYSLISDGKLKDIVKKPNVFMASFTIDGQGVGGYGGLGDMVSDNRYDGCLSINNSSGNIPKNAFYLDMKVNSIDNLEGDWKLKIKVDKTDIGNKIKECKIGKTIDLGDGDKLKIGKVRTTPLSTSIEVSGAMWKYSYFVIDDKGNEILEKGGGSDNEKGIINFRKLINADIKSLTFIPFQFNEDYKVDSRIYDINTLPIELSQGSIGKLIVNKLEWICNDTLKVHYSSEGIAPVTQSQSITLFDENNKAIISEECYKTQKDILDQRNFEMVFKGLDKNKKYKIGTFKIDEFYKINENLKFTIDLK